MLLTLYLLLHLGSSILSTEGMKSSVYICCFVCKNWIIEVYMGGSNFVWNMISQKLNAITLAKSVLLSVLKILKTPLQSQQRCVSRSCFTILCVFGNR